MSDGTRVPIVRKPPKRDRDAVPLLLPHQYLEVSRRVSSKRRLVKLAVIPAHSQSFVHVSTERSHSVLEPASQLCEKHSLALGNSAASIKPNCPFKVLVAKCSVHDKVLEKDQVIGTVLPHPPALENTSTKPPGSVSPDRENELESSSK